MYWNRNRYLAGNICFVLFLAFLFSLAFSVTGGPSTREAQASPTTPEVDVLRNNQQLSTSDSYPTDINKEPLQLTIIFRPVTEDFTTLIEQLFLRITNLRTQVQTVVYGVYLNATHVYRSVYGFVYGLVYTLAEAANFVYGDVYRLDFVVGDTVYKSVYVKVPTPPPEGGGPAPSPAPAPVTPPETKTNFGTVAWDKEAGRGEAKVDAALAANLIQEAKQKGQAAVDLRVAVPAEVTLKTFTAEVPAKALTEAVSAGTALLLGTTNVFAQLDVAKIPAEVKAQLAAKPEAVLSFNFNVLPEAEARQATTGLPPAYRVVGNVVTLELAFDGRALPGAVTLGYGGQAAARSGLFAALNLFGLFDGTKTAAAAVDEDKLGIYRYNDATKAWEYVGGRVDKVKKTITAKLAAVSLAKYAVMAFEKTFTDLVAHWAKRDVEIMAARHIAGGVSENLFAPDGQVTRAEFAALLIRTLGLAETKPAAPSFKDVAPGDWYYGAVETARAAGLVGGYPDGTFRPQANITREEIASMVHRALLYAGKKPAVAGRVDAILARFADAAAIGGWARESVAVAVSENILRGRTANTVVPKGNATRAEATVMLKRALVSLGELSE